MDHQCDAQQRRLLHICKEIVKGESYVELSEEEAEALDKAIFQEYTSEAQN